MGFQGGIALERRRMLALRAVQLGALLLLAPALASAEKVTILRDNFGTPHIFGSTEESVCHALGYAQAEDRLEELLKNYRKAEGTMAEVFGPEFFKDDVRARMWRHRAKSEELHAKKDPKVRAIIEAYQRGIKAFMEKHPERVPEWAPALAPWQVSALGRMIIWGWPEGEAEGELKGAGIEYDLGNSEYHGSNQWLVAPSRSKDKAVIACIDPHLSWYGAFRFYESRLYGGTIQYSGAGILGLPLATLGHSAFCSVAMTTGGPDTSDIYVDFVNPANPLQYRYDGKWRDMTVIKEKIGVRKEDKVDQVEMEFHYTHRGPVVARRGHSAYSMAIPYFNEVYHLDQVHAMVTAKNLTEMKKALSMRQYMAQNIMIGTVDGDIYYLRNGRVPIRPKGFDFTKPVPGDTSASEWMGIHEIADLVQIENPKQGYMQNCNVSPFAMMRIGAPTPERYPAYIYNAGRTPAHQRAAMTLEHLDANDSVTVPQALEIAMSTQVYGAREWQERLAGAWQNTEADTNAGPDLLQLKELIVRWDGHCREDSVGAIPYMFWKEAIPEDARKGDLMGAPPPASLTDEQVMQALKTAGERFVHEGLKPEVEFGAIYRVGREGSENTWPVGGGKAANGMATPRNIGFKARENGTFVGVSGQTSTQVVILTKPPQSWTYLPLGESDDPESAHFEDQAEHLFSGRKMKSSYFMNRAELEKHVETATELEF